MKEKEGEAKPEKKAPAPRPGGVHAGHRSRMRKRFMESGLLGFQEHEVVELLLFYAIPRRDVNILAHRLIDRFGTVAGVLDASEEELCSVPGVGPGVAHFLTIIPEVMVQMARQSVRTEHILLLTPQDLVRVMEKRCPECPMGHVLLILADLKREPIAIYAYDRFEDLDVRKIIAQVCGSGATNVFIVERVEDCSGPPLFDRLPALIEISRTLNTLEMPLQDYFTVDFRGNLPTSYVQKGYLLPVQL